MSELIKVKLSPLLAEEVYAHTVETGLIDHRSGNQLVRLTPTDISLYEKIEKDSKNLELTFDELKELYNELYNLEDIVLEWSENEIRWVSVYRAIKRHLAKFRAMGVTTNARGWAVI